MIKIEIIKVIVGIILYYLILKSAGKQHTSAFPTIICKKKVGKIEIAFKKLNIPYNILTRASFVLIGVGAFLITFIITTRIFPLKSIAVIVSLPFLATPMVTLNILQERRQKQLESGMKDFFTQLKNSFRTTDDVVEALRRIQNTILEPFATYTRQLLVEINTGRLPEVALDNFSKKIGIDKVTLYINNVKYCQAYGGDINNLTKRTQEIVDASILQKKKRKKETKEVNRVLYILIGLDLFVYFSFISKNDYYMGIMLQNFIGKTILNLNFASIWMLVWMSWKIKKLDY